MSTDPQHLYRPRNVELEARQVGRSTCDEVAAWCNGEVWNSGFGGPSGVRVQTPRGMAIAAVGYWIVRHVQGDFQVWEPPEFRRNFEAVYPSEEGSRFREWLGYSFSDHPEHYSEADMERAFRSGYSRGDHNALCWQQSADERQVACDRKREHKGGHSWELSRNLTPTARLLKAASEFMDLLTEDEISAELRGRIANGAVALAHDSLAALLTAASEAAR